MKAKLKEIADKGDILNDHGYFVKDYSGKIHTENGEININNPRLHLLFSIIPLIFKSSERKSIGSYGGKHVVEKFFSHEYISNGEFILVMMCLGYKYKVYKDTLNPIFYGYWMPTVENPHNFKYKFQA